MHSKKLITKNDANKLQNIAKELEDLLYDKEIISNLLKKISLQQNNYNSSHSSYTSTSEFSRLLKLTRNSEVVDIFVDSKIASKCMTYIKASNHNNNLRDFASYFGPGLFTSLFTSSIVGAVCGTSLDMANLNTTGTSSITNSSIPTSAILSAVNHSMCLSASNNRAESETLKNTTLNNINKQSKKKNINAINIDIQKSSKEIINRLISDDEYILKIFKASDIKLHFLSDEQDDILIKSGRNTHHVSANNLNNRAKQLKFIGEMMIGGISGPWLHYKKARNLYKDNLPKIEQLSEKQIELENLILKLYSDFFKTNPTINRFRY